MLLVLAIVVIYLVLGILYESFIHPLTILSGLPFAGFGALLALFIFQLDLSVYAFVGIIMLIGIVKKNAIMMIDFAIEAERKEGKNSRDSILEAASVRFRPIMMTTVAALMGTLPIALGAGAGAESRRPLGVAVVGGLAFSQLITLYITPVVYTYLDAFQHWVGRRKEREVVEPRGSEQAAESGAGVAESSSSEPVQRLVLCFERPNQRPMVGRRPRHDFDELGRRVPRALTVDPLPEPAHQ